MRFKYAWILGMAVGLLTAADARAEPNCTCWYAGQSFGLGTCVCIVTPNGARRACCNKVLNNTSWNFKDNTCAVAGTTGRPQVAETPPPVGGTQAPASSGRPASAQAMRPPARL